MALIPGKDSKQTNIKTPYSKPTQVDRLVQAKVVRTNDVEGTRQIDFITSGNDKPARVTALVALNSEGRLFSKNTRLC